MSSSRVAKRLRTPEDEERRCSPSKRSKHTTSPQASSPKPNKSGSPVPPLLEENEGMGLSSSEKPSPRLPPEVLLYFRDFLSKGSMKSTAARLVSANSEFYRLFLSILDYENLVLDERTAEGNCNTFVRAGFPGCGPDCFLNHIGKPRPLVWSDRKANLLKQCRYLTLKDRAALNALVEAHEHLQPEDHLFPNVTHLSLGEDLLWDLALEWQDDSTHHKTVEDLDQLKRVLRPYHLCVRFHRPEIHLLATSLRSAGQIRMATPQEEEEMIAELIASRRGITRLVEELCRAWPLESLTCHSLTSQPIPAAFVPLHRVIFRPAPHPLPDQRLVVSTTSRIEEIADAVCLLGPPDESKFEFIGIEHIGVYAPSVVASDSVMEDEFSEDVDNQDTARTPLLGPEARTSCLIGSIWEQIPQPEVREAAKSLVSFRLMEEARPCICCATL